MKTSTIVTAVAATLLMVSLSPISAAQGNDTPAGIEVITIVAKRPAPTLASICVNDAINQARATFLTETGVATEDSRLQTRIHLRQAIRQCVADAAGPDSARI